MVAGFAGGAEDAGWDQRYVNTVLLIFALQNFLFHVITAYDILRHKGVKIGKMDYLGF